MKHFYPVLLLIILILPGLDTYSQADPCAGFSATYTTTESRCASTGAVHVQASGGSGNYTYSVTGPVSMPVTSSPDITALPAGTYTLTVKDVTTGCTLTISNVIVDGNYADPRFDLEKTNVSCIGANNGTISVINQANGRDPFSYTIISPSPYSVGTSNSSGVFTGLPPGEYYVQLSDSCGGIQTRSIVIDDYTWWVDSYAVTPVDCNTVSILIHLLDNFGNNNITDTAFNGFEYGAVVSPGDTTWFTTPGFSITQTPLRQVTFIIKDRCGFLQTFVWNNPVPTLSNTVSISNKDCSTFTATATGISNVTTPQFCLRQGVVIISCNTTGRFNNIPYGSYCIDLTDNCYDTTISTCFNVPMPVPSVNPSVSISGRTCSDFTANITGETNLFNPQYCLYDNLGALITCNSTGQFTNLPYGDYCIHITSSPPCYDTTIIRCFTATLPNPSIDDPDITYTGCDSVDVVIPSVHNISSPQYCLYDQNNVLIGCNSTGQFTNLPYGTYCIVVQGTNISSGCSIAPVTKCFMASKPVPSVSATVGISNKNCSTFTATIRNKRNLVNPQFCLYDVNDVQITCNTSGVFNGLLYGSYCIKITHDCNDTLITRCFTESPDTINVSLTASASCIFGGTDIRVSPSGGNSPYTVSVMDPSNNIIASKTFSSSSYTFSGLPALGPGQSYIIQAQDVCGYSVTDSVAPVPSTFDRTITITGKCPNASNASGSSDVTILQTSNIGYYDPRVILKNGVADTILFSTANIVTPGTKRYVFAQLVPATYIFEYSLTSCSKKVYDTVVVNTYQYPSLQNSSVYQCDNNGFTVNAAAAGGIAPYNYEIIGSSPSTPSIISGPQTDPLFNISNGSVYSIVRLRVIDGCGNGTLGDISVLPLANISITTSGVGCMSTNLTMTTDAIPNAVYTWYKKSSPVDSVQLTGSQNYYDIPAILPADTGTYVVKAQVGASCLTRLAYFTVTGTCGGVLPVNLLYFKGERQNDKIQLSWMVSNETDIKQYILQRNIPGTTRFETIYQGGAFNTPGNHSYLFTDNQPARGVNEYRLLVTDMGGHTFASKIISVQIIPGTHITVAPNPASDKLSVRITGDKEMDYQVTLLNIKGEVVFKERTGAVSSVSVGVSRNRMIRSGFYLLQVTDNTQAVIYQTKIIFY